MTALAEPFPFPADDDAALVPAKRHLALVPTSTSPAPQDVTTPRPMLKWGLADWRIDMENLCGTGDPGIGLVRSVWASLAPLIQTGDTVTIATGKLCAGVVKMALAHTGARFLVRGGKDGADRALIDDADLEAIAARNHWLCIASGDVAFASLVRRAGLYGLHTWLVNGESGASQYLTQSVDIHSQLRITKPGRYTQPAAPLVPRPVAA